MLPRSSPPSQPLKIEEDSFHGLCPEPRLNFPVQLHGFGRCRGSIKLYGVWVAPSFAPSAPHQYSTPGKHITLPSSFRTSTNARVLLYVPELLYSRERPQYRKAEIRTTYIFACLNLSLPGLPIADVSSRLHIAPALSTSLTLKFRAISIPVYSVLSIHESLK